MRASRNLHLQGGFDGGSLHFLGWACDCDMFAAQVGDLVEARKMSGGELGFPLRPLLAGCCTDGGPRARNYLAPLFPPFLGLC